MENVKYIIPFFYTYRYNRRGIEGVAFFFEFTLLPFVLLLLLHDYHSFWLVFVTMVLVATIYEIGYIHNNVIAIKNEKYPTIRHEKEELELLRFNIYKIMAGRVVLSIILFILLMIMDLKYSGELLIALLAMIVIFSLYNTKKSGWSNRILFFLLRWLRYYTVLLFSGSMAIVISAIIASVNFINHFAWYKNRTDFSLSRFFGTKLFDALVYVGCFVFFYQDQKEELAYLFLYLFVVKSLLFVVSVFFKGVSKPD